MKTSIVALALLVSFATLAATPSSAQKEDLVRLPEAENQIFIEDGRHFVSSGIGLYEFVAGPDGITRIALGLDECGVNGLALLGDWLIAACNRDDGNFLYAGTVTATPELEELFELPDFFVANGVEITPARAILVADFTFFSAGRVARVEVEEIGGELVVTGYDGEFLAADEEILSPNGLARRGGDLFITDSGRVLKVTLGANDEYLGTETIYTLGTTFDDLAVVCTGLAVTDFVNGTLILIDAAGNDFTSPDLFQMPSSVDFGRAPNYGPNELIITERGIPGDAQSNIGNRVSRVTVPSEVIEAFCSPGS